MYFSLPKLESYFNAATRYLVSFLATFRYTVPRAKSLPGDELSQKYVI